MWSFGSKREEPAQTPSGKTSDGDNSGRELSPKGGGSLASKSRMFYKGKKLTSSSNHTSSKSNPMPPAIKSRTPNQEIRKKRQFTPGSTNRRKSAGNGADDYMQDVNVDETSSGIEVSFPGSQPPGTAQGMKGKTPTAVISLKEQILQRQLVFKGHFSTVISASNQNAFSSGTNKWRPKGHRIPLLGISPAETGYSDVLQLLKNTPVVDERTAVQQEFSLLETEISSLERDRISLEQSADPSGSNSSGFNKENATDTWNVHKLLKDDASKKQPLSVSERNTLQKQRGNSLTFHLSNNRTKEMLVLKLGGKQNSRSTSLVRNDDSITTIVPKNNSSIETGATTLQHVSLISPTNKAASNGGLYFSQDAGKSQSVGQLPNKLVQRLEKNEKGVEYLSYLSTGSRGCYFAKFQSGECWWGSAVEDSDFQKIMNAWDVYRVAFGPIRTIFAQQQALSNKPMLANSWIILSHDGKAVWKNLPSRLSDKLETRKANSAAPVEVSLGPGDSYFVRFLDGSIDYSLPSKIARVCERIEERGGKITNISLHPDISHDFVIRHTEVTR